MMLRDGLNFWLNSFIEVFVQINSKFNNCKDVEYSCHILNKSACNYLLRDPQLNWWMCISKKKLCLLIILNYLNVIDNVTSLFMCEQNAELQTRVQYLEGCECVRWRGCVWDGHEVEEGHSWQIDISTVCTCASGKVKCQANIKGIWNNNKGLK